MIRKVTNFNGEFQDPIIGGTYHFFKAYASGLWKEIYPQNKAKNMVLTYLHFRILEFPLTTGMIGRHEIHYTDL